MRSGYVAIDHSNGVVVLAFRGSKSWRNWFRNFEAWRVKSDLCDECHVHRGFWVQWESLRKTLIPIVEGAAAEYPNYRFSIVGHSHGGALATIAAADFRTRSNWFHANTWLYSYGSPRVGNPVTARFLTEQSDKSYRITARYDYVPHVPWDNWGYMHPSPEYFVAANPDDPEPEDVIVLTNYTNSKYEVGNHLQKVKWYHRHYVGKIDGGCE